MSDGRKLPLGTRPSGTKPEPPPAPPPPAREERIAIGAACYIAGEMGRREFDLALQIVRQEITSIYVEPNRTVWLVLGNGLRLAVMIDDEGNGPGTLHAFAGRTAVPVGLLGGR